MSRRAMPFVLLALVSTAGCGAKGSAAGEAPAPAATGSAAGSTTASATAATPASAPVRRGSRNLILAEEIRAANVQNAYEAVQRLRPDMLRPNRSAAGGPSISSAGRQAVATLPIVYIDNSRVGYPDELKGLPAHLVVEVRYLPTAEAMNRLGPGHDQGAILVKTMRQ